MILSLLLVAAGVGRLARVGGGESLHNGWWRRELERARNLILNCTSCAPPFFCCSVFHPSDTPKNEYGPELARLRVAVVGDRASSQEAIRLLRFSKVWCPCALLCASNKGQDMHGEVARLSIPFLALVKAG